MVFVSFGFFMVMTLFILMFWIYVLKDFSVSFGDNLMILFFVGFGVIVVLMKMVVVLETFEFNLRFVLIFEMLSIFLKVFLVMIVVYMEGEFLGYGVFVFDFVV